MDQSDIEALLEEAESLAAEVSDEEEVPEAQSESPRPPEPPVSRELPAQLKRILQIEVPVIVKLAEQQMTMSEVLDLNVGSVIEFEKRFDAELALLVSNCQIGLGRAVKVGENFGLRITRISSIYETIQALGH